MAGRDKEDLFEPTGPYEPVTTRIRNILREYKDGVGIFKELIQNADDAGATTVQFLVDWRRGPTDSLFSTGMAECQGPALWAYNDAVFTDEDFENINKLAGESKMEDLSKIGRFGLGFNAVYHITDVPSFVSREYFVIFDPTTHHLEHHIKDRSKPGIRINLAKKADALTHYQDQFQPYHGIFGCNILQTRGCFNYNGTLFRFPLRTAPQASTSDISNTAYSQDRIQAIVRSLCECASTLLVFTQHVKKVEIYKLDITHQPNQMQLILSVNKTTVKSFKIKGEKSNEPFIKQCSKWWEQNRDSLKSCAEYPSGCERVKITTTKEPSELSGCNRKISDDEVWFVVSATGTDVSLDVARSPTGRSHGLLPCGGIAIVIQGTSIASDHSGELFCFLPLSISTGLPVHVNGYFAIMSNRVGIWERTTTRNQPIEVTWNEALMEDALARAYIMLLVKMKEIRSTIPHSYEFHTLWPHCDDVNMRSWKNMIKKVCSVLLEQHKKKLFYSDGKWMSINEGFLLSDAFAEMNETAVNVLRSLGKHVFNLPSNILKTLAKFDQQGILQERTLTLTAFLEQHFFPKIKQIPHTQRDAIVCFGLDQILQKGDKSLKKLFQQNACVPVSKKNLAMPRGLIRPDSDAAQLFSKEDHRFPVGDDLCDDNRLYVLEALGMVKDLNWEGIYERAQSIAHLGFPAGTERSQKLIEYLNKRISQLPNPAGYRNLLQCARFMPVLTRPVDDYLLSWKGSSSSIAKMLAPNDVFLPKNAKLVGSSCYIVNTSSQSGCGKMNDDVQDLLGFSSRFPEDNFVIQQLDEAIQFWCKLSEEEKQDMGKRLAIKSICEEIYKFFNKIVDKAANQNFLNELRKRDWLIFHGKFVQREKVAYTSNGNGAPFLFTLPSNYKRDYRNLFEAMEIKETFDEEDYIRALYELQRTKQGNVLTEEELQTAIFFISQIQDVEKPAVKKRIGYIPLPDTNKILRPGKDVVVNLSLWIEDPGDSLKVHEKIPPQTAHALGAKPLKNVILKNCSRPIGYGESFGQHEDLTDRLRGILEGYAADGILKELVQNADDAQASEIHFILDTRTLASEKVVTEKETSEEIQGPALCVYNDSPFTEKDLKGIQQLGIGSKRDSPEMTGKYGIGFNSVYHLTDCPSFLSNYDTLVFLDPHCRYVPDADSRHPGKRYAISEQFRTDFSDTLDGYLAHLFNLQGSTMFRFPLRRAFQSKISKVSVDMENLLQSFQNEALNSLLFLNHIKKITLSKIGPSNKLEETYQVETVITPQDDTKRREMAQTICNLNNTPTAEIEWKGASYALTIKENKREVEKWLIQQCIGSTSTSRTGNSTFDRARNKIPDGRKLGLLPRGGLAARLWTHLSSSEKKKKVRGIVYCFLPLPEKSTSLPVHVNGHFALDSTRRGLWTETDDKGAKSEWNRFIKSCVLPQAYAALILEAKKHLCNDKNDNQLSRYHALFPKVSNNSPWKTLVIELYRYLGQTRAKVFPLLIPIQSEHEESTSISKETETSNSPEPPIHVTCTKWLSADQAYFVNPQSGIENTILHLLIRIGLPVLLHAPSQIHAGFESAHITSHTVNPTSAVDFLRGFKSPGSTSKIGQLPEKLETTAVRSVPELSALIKYCCDMEDFGKHLGGLPLLLTQDGFLRVFDLHQPVFCSEYGDLIPIQSHSFVHVDILSLIEQIVTNSKEKIVGDFTMINLAELLPHVFTDPKFKHNEDHVAWDFPPEGILSRNWFKRVWDYLQNYARPARGEDSVSLECLAEWPLIPTTCGQLVTIKKGKTVLDMTMAGNETTAQENVRTFLRNLKCPVLDRKITCGTKDQTTTKKAVLERKTSVTDPYVAHPHNVEDVLLVLHHMLKTNALDISLVDEYEIRNFLRFVQDNYKADRLEECKRILKCLPFHKALNGQYVSLTGQYSSYALIPSGVPTQQLEDLQKRANCLFLNSDALPALEKLYSDLGVRAGQNVMQFYVEYVFKHFSMFTRESQMQHLMYIRDKVYPSLPRGGSDETKLFLESMTQNPCIPDESGHLHYAWEFYDPNNEVFRLMFQDEESKFPPSPFNNEDWSDLLQDIGLFVEITPQLFLEFCTKVAEDGRQSPCNPQNQERSQVLVKCIFSKKALQKEEILSQLSQIKFLAPTKVDDQLTSIHQQYQCPKNGSPPFIEFRNAVPSRFSDISWTSASILPIWIQTDNINILQSLGVACSGPTYTKVVDHLKNVATSYSPDTVNTSSRLHKISKSIYIFLCKVTKCSGRNPNDMDNCSNVCVDIGKLLKGVSCIFLQEDRVFVKAEQLVFNLPNDCPLKPYLYGVPRGYEDLGHFLQRLGATVKPKPSQVAYVLKAMHDQEGDKMLSFEKEYKAKYAMHLLFELLYKGEHADEIDELYLPSQDKRLVKSCELVCKVSSRFADVVKKLHLPILLRFQECKLKKSSDDYIDALPEHLRPKKFEDLVREDVDPECKDSICPEAEQGSTCSFQQRFESLLRSEEFQEGLKRLLMADNQNPKEFEHIIRKLQTSVRIKCTGVDSIKICIINRDTNVVLSCLKEICYAVQNEDSWSLYLQHEFGNDRSLESITSCVNKVLGDCINKDLELSGMLGCSSPSDISNRLNKRGITQSLSKDADNFTPPDDNLYFEWGSGHSTIRKNDGIEERNGFGGVGGTTVGGGRSRGIDMGMDTDASSNDGAYGFDYHGGTSGSRGIDMGMDIDASSNDGAYGFDYHSGGSGSRGIDMGMGGGPSFNDGGYGIGYHGGGGDHSRFFPSSREEAMRWVKQSKSDLEGAKLLLQSDPPFCALACFHSHQVAEKCLKATLFAECGISGKLLGSYEIRQLEPKVREDTEIPNDAIQCAKKVEGYYLCTRYPNCQPFDVVPAEAFDKDEAEIAIDAASKVLEYVEEYIKNSKPH